MFELYNEKKEDYWDVEALFDLCFTPSRFALSSYRLREGYSPINDLCLIAKSDEDLLVGAIRYWPAEIEKKGFYFLDQLRYIPPIKVRVLALL